MSLIHLSILTRLCKQERTILAVARICRTGTSSSSSSSLRRGNTGRWVVQKGGVVCCSCTHRRVLHLASGCGSAARWLAVTVLLPWAIFFFGFGEGVSFKVCGGIELTRLAQRLRVLCALDFCGVFAASWVERGASKPGVFY